VRGSNSRKRVTFRLNDEAEERTKRRRIFFFSSSKLMALAAKMAAIPARVK